MTIADTLQPVLEKKFPAALVAAFMLVATTPASASEIKARYCATVAAHHAADRKADRQLSSLMDAFARRHELGLNGEHQVGTDEYRGVSAILDVTFGMGEFGAVVALYSEKASDNALVAALDGYLRDDVAPVFKVTLCNRIPGFQAPTLSTTIR
ncbi:MAG: hypothetical protein ISS15_09275 [Alphaproteobacteria bacterium]|nr:hypothetical protein [Alphaproteobacteria bacterium]MBL6938807.1 hypothetical protein [Alphaproteobacteria bacterium]MBL7097836.1 hypothetical protein [Alphaproteobacteria bacterium]